MHVDKITVFRNKTGSAGCILELFVHDCIVKYNDYFPKINAMQYSARQCQCLKRKLWVDVPRHSLRGISNHQVFGIAMSGKNNTGVARKQGVYVLSQTQYHRL